MYFKFYDLEKEPFHITPDPEFLFLSPMHKEALAVLIYGVQQRKGFIAIIGEVGLGKTTIIRSYLEQADKQALKAIYILNPDVSFGGLLQAIYREQEIVVPETADVSELVDRLHLLLIDEYKQGRTVVLIIDEAQNMPIETLENLRMLSNLETSKDKLIQIVLVGQPEFEEKLNLKELRQLNQRIIMRAHIQPISRRESVAYIQHRLSKAGRKDIDIFSKSALRLIIRHARGIPRILSVLCGNALVTGVGYQEKQITARTAREVIADFEGTKKMNPLKWLLVAISLAVIISGIAVIYQHQGHVLSSARELFNYRSPETRKTEAETVVVTEPVKAPPIKIEVAQPAEKETSKPADNTSKSEENKSKPAKSKFPIKKVVNKGDTLYSLVREVYGKSSNELIALVKKQNKRIGKDGKIQTGERLNFPEPANRKSADDN